MMLINRKKYMDKLNYYKGTEAIKIITGMRRCGKSTLLQLFKDELIDTGVKKDNIIFMNFESMKNKEYTNSVELYNYLSNHIKTDEVTYIMLDEIQNVSNWEETINSLKVDYVENVDIYITGSNAYLLSSELSTLLSGRYVEIKMLPLSFKEFLDFYKQYYPKNNLSTEDKFQEYLYYGSSPLFFKYEKSDNYFKDVLEGIYNTILIKDVVQRNNIKNTVLLENLIHFLLDNIGNIISSKAIVKYLKSEYIKTTPTTILEYLKALNNAYLLYAVRRYDIKGKRYLKTLEKEYVVDIGLRNAILGSRNVDMGHVLENIVYFELLYKGYNVTIGNNKDYEIDFIAVDHNDKKYYQVTQSISDEKTLEQECKALESITDNYDKIILSMDKTFVLDRNGIKFQNIIDFLLE